MKKATGQIKKCLLNQCGSSLLLVVLTMAIAFALCTAMLGIASAQRLKHRTMERGAANFQNALQTRYAAEAGVARGIVELQRSYKVYYRDTYPEGSWFGEEELVPGVPGYRTDFRINHSSGHEYDLAGWGRDPQWSTEWLDTRVKFNRKPVFDYLFFSNQSLHLTGKTDWLGSWWDIYSNVGTNGDLTLEGGVTVHGDARAGGAINLIPRKYLWSTYTPVITGSRLPNQPRLEFPSILGDFNLDGFVAKHYGQKKFNNGSVTISSNPVGDVLYTGDITITSAVTEIKGDVVSRDGTITIYCGDLTIRGNVVAKGDIIIPSVTAGDTDIYGNLVAEGRIIIDDDWGTTDSINIHGGSIVAKNYIQISEDVEIWDGDIICTNGNIKFADANETFPPEETNVAIHNGDILVPNGWLNVSETSATSGLILDGGVVATKGDFDLTWGGALLPDVNIEPGVIYVKEGLFKGDAEFDLRGSAVFNDADLTIEDFGSARVDFDAGVVDELTPRLPGTVIESRTWQWR